MTPNSDSSDQPNAAIPSPRKWRRRLVRAGKVLLALVLLVVVLFILNGRFLAMRETPRVGKAVSFQPSAISPTSVSPSKSVDADDADPAEIKILSYNIAKGMLNDGTWHVELANVDRRLAAIADLIRREQPDLVFLSESVFECEPCSRNQIQYLAERTDLHDWAFGENYNIGLPFFRAVGGNAILSRWPIQGVTNASLSGAKPFYITKNNRRVLWCEVRLGGQSFGGQPLLLGAVHNDSFDMANNLVQAREELAYIGDRPAILAGDFNARPTEPAIRLLAASGRFTAKLDGPLTFPTEKPDQTIDFIFAPKDWTLVEHHVPQCDASDHLPIVSTFRRKK